MGATARLAKHKQSASKQRIIKQNDPKMTNKLDKNWTGKLQTLQQYKQNVHNIKICTQVWKENTGLLKKSKCGLEKT